MEFDRKKIETELAAMRQGRDAITAREAAAKPGAAPAAPATRKMGM